MSRYWRVYRTFVASSLARELEFRANFFAKVIQNVMWSFFFLMILLVIYRNTDSVAGWGRGDAMLLAATVFVMNSIAGALFFSLTEIPSQVRMGTLDFVVTKPIDTQYWVSIRRFSFDNIGSFIAGLVLIAIAVRGLEHTPNLIQWLYYILLVGVSLALYYAFNLALMTTGIWLVRVDNLWVLGDSITQVARFPLDIYSSGLQRFLTFVVPLGFLATVPARQLIQGANLETVMIGVAWAIGALFLSRRFWRYAMRHYTSASS